MDKALKTMIDNMPSKTGKSLGKWIEILRSKSFDKHMEAVNYLKKEHGVTHGFANTIVTLSKDAQTEEVDLVSIQYIGKENLLPVYNELIKQIVQLGNDITITPKKTSVSIIRKKQFALIKPATKSRIDLGLKIKDKAIGGRLEDSGPFGTMCTHRVRLESLDDISIDVIKWLKEAYDSSI